MYHPTVERTMIAIAVVAMFLGLVRVSNTIHHASIPSQRMVMYI
jgi:hypothetical protein